MHVNNKEEENGQDYQSEAGNDYGDRGGMSRIHTCKPIKTREHVVINKLIKRIVPLTLTFLPFFGVLYLESKPWTSLIFTSPSLCPGYLQAELRHRKLNTH